MLFVCKPEVRLLICLSQDRIEPASARIAHMGVRWQGHSAMSRKRYLDGLVRLRSHLVVPALSGQRNLDEWSTAAQVPGAETVRIHWALYDNRSSHL